MNVPKILQRAKEIVPHKQFYSLLGIQARPPIYIEKIGQRTLRVMTPEGKNTAVMRISGDNVNLSKLLFTSPIVKIIFKGNSCDLNPLEEQRRNLRNRVNPSHWKFVEELDEFYLEKGTRRTVTALVTLPFEDMVPLPAKASVKTRKASKRIKGCSLRYPIIETQEELAQTVKAIWHESPIKKNTYPKMRGALEAVAPAKKDCNIEKGVFSSGHGSLAFWKIVVVNNPENFQRIIEAGFDIAVEFTNVRKNIWAKVIAKKRVSSFEEHAEFERTLGNLVDDILRVVDADEVIEAFRAFVPGAWENFPGEAAGIEDPFAYVKHLQNMVSPPQDISSAIMMGKNKYPRFLTDQEEFSVACIGPSDSGKTTALMSMALQRGTVIYVPLSPKQDPLAKWIKEKGKVISVDQMDETDPESEKTLLRRITAGAVRDAQEIANSWRNKQPPEIGNLIIDGNCSICHYQYLSAFLNEITKQLAQHNIGKVTIFLDDVANIPAHEDNNLGKIPYEVGKLLRQRIRNIMVTYRTAGVAVYLTAHSIGELRDPTVWSEGFFESIARAFRFPLDKHQKGESFSPRDYTEAVKEAIRRGDDPNKAQDPSVVLLDVNLPDWVLNILDPETLA